jgi:biopolymer transport protein ExbB/TolQ
LAGFGVTTEVHRYNAARRQSSAFVRDTAPAMRDGKFDEVITIAARNSRSHVASIVAEGLAAYALAPSDITDTEAIAVAQRAFQRSSKVLAAHWKVGLSTLATIASSAPFIGFLGTVYGIQNAFRGGSMPPSTALASLASRIADALILGAMGLLVSVLAVWCFSYLRGRSGVFESEMSNAELEAVTCLRAHPQWREQFEHSAAARTTMAGAGDSAARSWEVAYDQQLSLLPAMWCCALYLAYVLARDVYWSWLYR